MTGATTLCKLQLSSFVLPVRARPQNPQKFPVLQHVFVSPWILLTRRNTQIHITASKNGSSWMWGREQVLVKHTVSFTILFLVFSFFFFLHRTASESQSSTNSSVQLPTSKEAWPSHTSSPSAALRAYKNISIALQNYSHCMSFAPSVLSSYS